jgi:hypothetical protein
MNITDPSCLSAKAQEVLRDIDRLIDAYQFKSNHSDSIQLWSDAYDAVQRSVKRNLKMDLKTNRYRGYLLIRKEKRARGSKKNFNQVFK